jgi:hypothetical protein
VCERGEREERERRERDRERERERERESLSGTKLLRGERRGMMRGRRGRRNDEGL